MTGSSRVHKLSCHASYFSGALIFFLLKHLKHLKGCIFFPSLGVGCCLVGLVWFSVFAGFFFPNSKI